MIRVSIADDHKVVANGIGQMMGKWKQLSVLDTYYGGTALLEGLKNRQPDVLLLDLQMPDIGGEELLPVIRESWPRIRVLMLTGMDATYYVREMLDLGAMGYVLKNTDEETLVAAIEAVHAGKQFIDPSLKEALLEDMLKKKRSAASAPILTHREKEILKLIIAECTSQEIADKLYLSLRTVENYRLGIMQKLGTKNAAGLVKVALRMGLVD